MLYLKARNDLWVGVENWDISEVAHELKFKYQDPPMPDMGDGDDKDSSSGSGKSGGSSGSTTALPWVTPDPNRNYDQGGQTHGDTPIG